MELNDEEESTLRELHSADKNGTSAKDFINERLYTELTVYGDMDDMGQRSTTRLDGFDKQKAIFTSLYKKGAISGYVSSRGHEVMFESLTSDGRRYFATKKAKRSEATKARWGARVWQIAVAALGVVLSVLASIITTNIRLDQ